MNLELKSISSWLNLLSVSFHWVMETALLNKRLPAVHGYSTYEDTIIALRMVKDELLRVPNHSWIVGLSAFWSKYEADRLARLQAENA